MIEQKRILATSIPGPASQALQQRKVAAVAAGVSTGLPVYVTEASGGILRDADGNQLIDFGSGIAVTTVGNRNQRIIDAVTEQITAFTHTCFMVTPYDSYVQVCEKLNELTPGDHEKRSALFNSGAEAVENAVKIARHATGRQAVVAFDHGYHGRTNLTMGLTAKNMPYKHGFGPFASELYRVPMAYPYRWPGGAEHCAEQALRTVTDQIHAQVGESNTAAVIIEPIQGEGGFIVPPRGSCRGSPTGAASTASCSSPTRCSPASAAPATGSPVTTRASSPTSSPPPRESPVACRWPRSRARGADGCRAPGWSGRHLRRQPGGLRRRARGIESMEADNLAARAREIGDILTDRLGRLAEKYDEVGEVRGRGAMIAMELVTDAESKEPAAALTSAVNKGCHERGLVTLTCGTYGNVFRFLPPLSISDDLLHEGMDVLEESFTAAVG
jgi:4-aminobutyrate aminotransferase/(S)-3-amino-2-methylpropionate transaminase